jgi:ATP-binding cassette subfamily C protein
LEQLLADCQQVAEPSLTGDQPWDAVQRGISLHQVTLTYPQRTQPTLQGVDLHLPVRTTTALIGASGAGKSTVADVLLGLLAPDAGELRVDDVPITGAARLRWRQAVAYVPQETFLFHASIRDNLLWGKPTASEAELQSALQQAAADFVMQLPEGLATVVGDGGICLSGGERQRVALARALLTQPSLLILDEATSALDPNNETRIREALENLHGDVTVVLIGHRLATLEHADQVIVLGQGRVLAQGTWAQVRAVAEVG